MHVVARIDITPTMYGYACLIINMYAETFPHVALTLRSTSGQLFYLLTSCSFRLECFHYCHVSMTFVTRELF